MIKRVLVSFVISIVIAFVSYYFILPPLNIQSAESWVYVLVIVAIFVALNSGWMFFRREKSMSMKKIMFAIVIVFILFIIVNIISLPLFHSKKYASQITLQDANFETDFVEEENVSNIALMDTESAIIIGNRTLGTLSDLVSQFKVSTNYTQINYQGKPMKIAPLNYNGIIKYFKNDGIPGYVLVDPVNNTAEFVRLEQKIKYSDSAYFWKNLNRKLRFDYPTLMFGEKHFEIDDDGNTYWICPVYKANAFLFGAKNISSVVVLNAVTGKSTLYDIDDAPSWIDYVYSGDKISELYNWYGLYKSGFFNSIFGQEGCTSTTDDFGYKTIGDDVYVFTGITSLTADDESNVGFIMVNARTGEFKYYNVSGAEEYSAMAAAQGEVQQYNYKASFPSVINVKGEPTYLMVLKDNNSIVKLYAMVNMENYNLVATGSTQEEALTAYRKLIGKNTSEDDVSEDDIVTNKITISDIDFVVVDGETICYIKDANMNYYKIPFSENLILLNVGDEVTIQYTKMGTITELVSVKKQ